MKNRVWSTATVLFALCVAPWAASAQTLGGGAPKGGKLLTKDELRTCMKQQASLNQRGAQLEALAKTLNAEGDGLEGQRGSFQAERDDVKARNEALKQFNDQQAAYVAKVNDWNARKKELDEIQNKPPAWIERRQAQLEKERKDLQKEYEAAEATGKQLAGDLDSANQRLETKQAQYNQSVDAWNAKKIQLEKDKGAFELDRDEWRLSCGNRRYREEDEQAIKAGK